MSTEFTFAISRRTLAALARVLTLTLILPVFPQVLQADHTPDPATVTTAGDMQQELGCPGDWQPDCAATYLGFDAEDDVWQQVFNVPAGTWMYKAALNDSWDESYGEGAVQGGANIGLGLGADTDVKFYYDHKTHWITDNVNSEIATAVGNFQSALGCSGDWQPWCLRSRELRRRRRARRRQHSVSGTQRLRRHAIRVRTFEPRPHGWRGARTGPAGECHHSRRLPGGSRLPV
jgi:hypothetical protein